MEEMITNPILHIKCSKCGAVDYNILGNKGGRANTYIGKITFGKVLDTKLLKVKCLKCNEKFDVGAEVAEESELNEEPATIKITRNKRVSGILAKYYINFNGLTIAPISNGETVELTTATKDNIITILDPSGVANVGFFKVPIKSNETKEINFKFKWRIV